MGILTPIDVLLLTFWRTNEKHHININSPVEKIKLAICQFIIPSSFTPTLNIAFLCNWLKYTGAIAGNHFGLLKYSIKTSPLGRYFKRSYIKIGNVQNILTMQTIGQAQSSSMEQQTDQPKHSKAQCLNLLKGKRNPTSFLIL